MGRRVNNSDIDVFGKLTRKLLGVWVRVGGGRGGGGVNNWYAAGLMSRQ